MAYLSDLHPELFHATPRAGGVAVITKPKSSAPKGSRTSSIGTKGSKVTFASGISGKSSLRSYASGRSSVKSGLLFDSAVTSTPQGESREQRIKKVLLSSTWNIPDEDEYEDSQIPSSFNNVGRLLAVVMSTVMMMSNGYKIPTEHLQWTLSFLECIRDEYGQHPPNIQGVLNNIKLIDNTLQSFLKEDMEEDELLGAVTTVNGDETEIKTQMPEGEAQETAEEVTE